MAEKVIEDIDEDSTDDSDPEPEPTPETQLEPAPAEPVELEIGKDLCVMYGYIKDILTENLTEREKAILICKSCTGIMKEACISERGEQLCSGCCVHGKQTPNLSIRETINSLKCSCPLIERGCKWLGTLEGCEKHLDTCGYVQEKCKLGCGVELTRDKLRIHEKENCPQRLVKCDHCNTKIKSCQLNRHHDECPKMKVSCDLCGTKMTREEMELHLKHDCGMVQEMCKLGCGVELTRDKLRIHEKENCPQRLVKCDHCNTKIKSCQLNRHHDECPKMEVSCDLVGCDTKITREEIELHLKHDCVMVQEMCKLGCGVELTRDKLGIHEKDNCVQRKIQCEHCSIDLIFCDNSKHLEKCPEMKVLCGLCGVEKCRKDMIQHFKDDCPEKMLVCPFVKYKCLTRMKRKDIDKHLEEKETKHLGLKLNAMEDFITKQSEINKKQSEEINKLNENIEKQKKETTTELSNTSQQIRLLYFITDTTKIIWKIENVKDYRYFSESRQYLVAGCMSALRFQYGRLSIVFRGTTIKPDRPFIAKCHIVLLSRHTINCGMIEVKQKDVLRGCERLITPISQEDIDKYSEPQFPDATKKDLTLEIFITMQ